MTRASDRRLTNARARSGTGNTIPLWCYESDWEVFDAISGISQVGNASDVQLGRQWARAGVDANMCLERAEKTAGLLSTAFGARDLLRVSEAESDGLLRFWGEFIFRLIYFIVHKFFLEREARERKNGFSADHGDYDPRFLLRDHPGRYRRRDVRRQG